jgi:DNA polymerase-1
MESRLLLQVHDELILESPPDEVDAVSQILRDEMSAAMSLTVPLVVSVESGTSWGALH